MGNEVLRPDAHRRVARAAALAVFLLVSYQKARCSEIAVPIPVVRGVALSGDPVVLPSAFAGKAGVLVLGFSQGSRVQVTAWGRRLAADYRDSARVLYYEVPVLASVPRLLRGWVLKKVSAEVPDRARARFLPVYDHEPEWRAAAGYAAGDEAYVLVVDGAGVVRFRLQGEATDAAYTEVKKRIEAMR